MLAHFSLLCDNHSFVDICKDNQGRKKNATGGMWGLVVSFVCFFVLILIFFCEKLISHYKRYGVKGKERRVKMIVEVNIEVT